MPFCDESGKITWIVGSHLAMGQLRLEQGREEEARQHFETCVDAFKKWEFTTNPLFHVETLLHLTSIYANNGEHEKARNTAQWAKRLSQQLRSDAGLAMAWQAEGKIQRSLGEEKAVLDAYLTCLDLWRKAGWPYYLARALVEYSEALAQTSPDESQKMLEEAAEIFGKLGAKPSLEKAQVKLHKS
jgi:tetratricopeptide (TPR) repeat protein